MRILVVEDEAAMRNDLQTQLIGSGFCVDVTGDGEEGLSPRAALLSTSIRRQKTARCGETLTYRAATRLIALDGRGASRLDHEVAVDNSAVLRERTVEARVQGAQAGDHLLAVLASQWAEEVEAVGGEQHQFVSRLLVPGRRPDDFSVPG